MNRNEKFRTLKLKKRYIRYRKLNNTCWKILYIFTWIEWKDIKNKNRKKSIVLCHHIVFEYTSLYFYPSIELFWIPLLYTILKISNRWNFYNWFYSSETLFFYLKVFIETKNIHRYKKNKNTLKMFKTKNVKNKETQLFPIYLTFL